LRLKSTAVAAWKPLRHARSPTEENKDKGAAWRDNRKKREQFMAKSEIRARHFERFTGEIGATRRARLSKGVAPFTRDHGSGEHFRAEPSDFLEWVLFEALRAAGVSARVAAREVKASHAAEQFLDLCALGANASGLLLVAWIEAESTDEAIELNWRAATVGADDIAQILGKSSQNARLWFRNDDGPSRTSKHLGTYAMLAVPVSLQWRMAINRARTVGIDLKPGSATLLDEASR